MVPAYCSSIPPSWLHETLFRPLLCSLNFKSFRGWAIQSLSKNLPCLSHGYRNGASLVCTKPHQSNVVIRVSLERFLSLEVPRIEEFVCFDIQRWYASIAIHFSQLQRFKVSCIGKNCIMTDQALDNT